MAIDAAAAAAAPVGLDVTSVLIKDLPRVKTPPCREDVAKEVELAKIIVTRHMSAAVHRWNESDGFCDFLFHLFSISDISEFNDQLITDDRLLILLHRHYGLSASLIGEVVKKFLDMLYARRHVLSPILNARGFFKKFTITCEIKIVNVMDDDAAHHDNIDGGGEDSSSTSAAEVAPSSTEGQGEEGEVVRKFMGTNPIHEHAMYMASIAHMCGPQVVHTVYDHATRVMQLLQGRASEVDKNNNNNAKNELLCYYDTLVHVL